MSAKPFAKVCRRYSNAHQVQEDENDTESEQSDSDNEYLHQILSVTDSKEGSEWWEKVVINGCTTNAQIDTSSLQSLISYDLYKKLNCGPLQSSDCKFMSYTKHTIKVYGYIYLQTMYKSRNARIKYYVVETEQRANNWVLWKEYIKSKAWRTSLSWRKQLVCSQVHMLSALIQPFHQWYKTAAASPHPKDQGKTGWDGAWAADH